LTTVLFSLAPIWQSLRVEVNAALKDGGRGMTAGSTGLRGNGLVVFQVSLSVLLLAGAGLFVRTLSNLRSVNLGFRPERVLLFTIDAPRARYQGSARRTLFARLDEAIRAIPAVEAASLSSTPLLAGGRSQTRVGPDGRTSGPEDEAWVNDVGSGFFETMGIPILFGRPFDEHQRESSAPVVVISQQFARRFFPNEIPLGRTIRNGDVVYEIVGIAGDTPFGRIREPNPPTFYRHFTQTREPGAMTFEVRTRSGRDKAVMNEVRAAVRAIDKDLPVFDVRTQEQQIDALLARERLFVALTSTFGVLAAFLASIGVYGLLAHRVSRRTAEIGLRLALGARQSDVLVMILREAAFLASLGAVIGVVAAAALSRYVRAILFGVAPADPATLGAALALVMVVALLAGWFPARTASRLDPMTALRHD
jgi:predicted permease